MFKTNQKLLFLLAGLFLTTGLLILTSCTKKPPVVSDNGNNNSNVTNNNQNQTNRNTSNGAFKEFVIEELEITIKFPKNYEINKNSEKNRRGSFLSYDFSQTDLPAFNEIQFFSNESITNFINSCEDDPCFFGDYPNMEKYNGQNKAFSNQEDYLNYKLSKFNDRYFFVSNHDCTGDSCIIREYTTFIDDMKIDIWVIMENESQIDKADELFEKFEIVDNGYVDRKCDNNSIQYKDWKKLINDEYKFEFCFPENFVLVKNEKDEDEKLEVDFQEKVGNKLKDSLSVNIYNEDPAWWNKPNREFPVEIITEKGPKVSGVSSTIYTHPVIPMGDNDYKNKFVFDLIFEKNNKYYEFIVGYEKGEKEKIKNLIEDILKTFDFKD